LLKRIVELEQQVRAKKPADLEFRVSDKGGVSVYTWANSRRRSITNSDRGCWTISDELRIFMEKNKGRLKLKARAEV
jgi:hypothetical protein